MARAIISNSCSVSASLRPNDRRNRRTMSLSGRRNLSTSHFRNIGGVSRCGGEHRQPDDPCDDEVVTRHLVETQEDRATGHGFAEVFVAGLVARPSSFALV